MAGAGQNYFISTGPNENPNDTDDIASRMLKTGPGEECEPASEEVEPPPLPSSWDWQGDSDANDYDAPHGNVDHNLDGGGGDDIIDGFEGNDFIYGNDGNDTLFGGTHDDILRGGTGDDILNGGTGDDSLWGEDGNDLLSGQNGNDELYGGKGDDELYGGNQVDELYGESGDDLLSGGQQNDTLDGGSGTDTAVFSGNQADYTINCTGTNEGSVTGGPDGNDTLSNIEKIKFDDTAVPVDFCP
jgi:Ca2+-binding RTX toxin-like protein